MVMFLVRLLSYQEFGNDIEPRFAVDLVFGWLHADGAKLLKRISHDQHISGK